METGTRDTGYGYAIFTIAPIRLTYSFCLVALSRSKLITYIDDFVKRAIEHFVGGQTDSTQLSFKTRHRPQHINNNNNNNRSTARIYINPPHQPATGSHTVIRTPIPRYGDIAITLLQPPYTYLPYTTIISEHSKSQVKSRHSEVRIPQQHTRMEDCSLSSSKRQNKKARKEGGCYHCGSSSHRAKSCPNATCRLCEETGHDVGGCPNKPLAPVDLGQFKAQAQAQTHVDSNDTPNRGFSYIELFCGMGGFRVALDKLGGKCVFASEIDRFCVQNYQENFGDRPAGDICRIQTHEIPNHDLLVGGFPCQPFSSSGARLGIHDPNGRGVLFREIVRILKGKKPRAFLLENVRGLYLHDDGNTLKVVVKELEECGYAVKYELVDAVKLLPQERCRLFLVGTRRDLQHLSSKDQAQQTEFKFPNLPHLARGIRDILHHPEDGHHLTALEMEKLTLNPNQLNKVKSQKYTQEHPEARFLSDPTVAAKTIQSSYTKYMVGSQFIPVQFGKDGNDEWRRFSSREVARLQGFPESFRLCKDRAYHMIGNAVAPPVIVMIAAPLLQFVHVGGGGDDDHDETTRDWGWTVAQSLLLEASPDDSRRKELESKLCLVRTVPVGIRAVNDSSLSVD